MNNEGLNIIGERTYEEQGRDPEVVAAFAQAEAGMEPIPEIVEVEDVNALAELLGVNLEALEQYRTDERGV